MDGGVGRKSRTHNKLRTSNRRRIRGEHGKELLRRRGELPERSCAHVGGFNLSLVMRQLLGKGHAARSAGLLGGCSADFVAVLDSGSGFHRTGKCIGPAAMPSHAIISLAAE